MTLTVRYFAWVRERVGTASEEVATTAPTVEALVGELSARDEMHALAFADMAAVRVAVDQEMAEMSSPIIGAQEVAFFPPMTGG